MAFILKYSRETNEMNEQQLSRRKRARLSRARRFCPERLACAPGDNVETKSNCLPRKLAPWQAKTHADTTAALGGSG